jgi:hypothetical protein
MHIGNRIAERSRRGLADGEADIGPECCQRFNLSAGIATTFARM